MWNDPITAYVCIRPFSDLFCRPTDVFVTQFFWRYSVTLDLPNRGRKNLVTQYSTTMQKVGQLCTTIALGKGQKRVTKVRAEWITVNVVKSPQMMKITFWRKNSKSLTTSLGISTQRWCYVGNDDFPKKKGSFMKICLLLRFYVFALIRDLFCTNQWSKTSKISPRKNFFALLGSLFTWSMPFTYKKCINFSGRGSLQIFGGFIYNQQHLNFLRAIQI